MAVSFSGARVWLGAFCVVAVAGCGGRTSMFTPGDDPSLGSSEPSGGSTSVGGSTSTTHPTPSGGASSTPAGGTPSTSTGVAGGATAGGSPGVADAPSTGTGGAAGATSTSAAAADMCKTFCAQATDNCPNQFASFPECFGSCTNELGASEHCLLLGEAVMTCFAPFIQGSSGGHCTNPAEAQCAPQLQQFQQCSDSVTPTPVPIPVPAPTPEPASNCTSSGSSSAVTCNLTSKCADGSYYLVNCKQNAQNESDCTCQSGNGSSASAGGAFNLNESVAFACYDGISTCGGPVSGPPLPE